MDSKAMNVLRTLVHIFAGAAMFLLVFLWLIPGVFLSAVTNEDNPKEWLDEAGVYDNLVTGTVEVLKFQVANGDISEDELDDAIVQIINGEGPVGIEEVAEELDEVYDGSFVQDQVELAIDVTYDYLSGEIEDPVVTINLEPRQDQIKDGLNSIYNLAIENLPVCTDGTVIDDADDILELDCVPPQEQIEDRVAEFVNEFVEEDLEAEVTINLEEEFSDDGDRPDSDVFNAAKSASLWLFVSALFFGIVAVVSLPRLYRAFISTGIMLMIVSSFAGIVYVGLRAVAIDADDVIEGAELNEDVPIYVQEHILAPLLNVVGRDIANMGTLRSTVIFVIGLALLGGGLYLRTKRKPEAKPKTQTPKPKPKTPAKTTKTK